MHAPVDFFGPSDSSAARRNRRASMPLVPSTAWTCGVTRRHRARWPTVPLTAGEPPPSTVHLQEYERRPSHRSQLAYSTSCIENPDGCESTADDRAGCSA